MNAISDASRRFNFADAARKALYGKQKPGAKHRVDNRLDWI